MLNTTKRKSALLPVLLIAATAALSTITGHAAIASKEPTLAPQVEVASAPAPQFRGGQLTLLNCPAEQVAARFYECALPAEVADLPTAQLASFNPLESAFGAFQPLIFSALLGGFGWLIAKAKATENALLTQAQSHATHNALLQGVLTTTLQAAHQALLAAQPPGGVTISGALDPLSAAQPVPAPATHSFTGGPVSG